MPKYLRIAESERIPLRERRSICAAHNHPRVSDIQAVPKLAKKLAARVGRRGPINHQLLM